jgi:predicted hydrocarbon binding protein
MSDFSKIRSGESEGIRFGKLFAEIYYYMGKNILEVLGEEEGGKVIAKAVREFGEDRVASMKAEAAERGIEVTDEESFFSIRDMPNCGWQSGERRGICTRCLFDEVLKSYGETGRKMMKLYCPIDYIIYGSFGFELDRPQCKGDGDDTCVFNLSRKK